MSTPLAEIFNKFPKKNLVFFELLFFIVYKQWLIWLFSLGMS
jgi:hypothetical protein